MTRGEYVDGIDRPETRERILREIQQEFGGKVIWGEDLMRITLSGCGLINVEAP